MEAVKFECPHCHATIDVEATSVGEIVACPESDCGLPFRAAPPEGRALEPVAQHVEVDSEESPVATENLEKTLFVRHPAMFRRRPFSFLGLWGVVVLGAFGFVGSFVGLVWSPIGAGFQMWLSLTAIVAAGAALIAWWVSVIDVTLTVTTERTTYRAGLFSKRTTEVLHDDVRNIQMDQKIVERIMGVGDIALSSSGQDDLEIEAKAIPRPDEIVAAIREYQLA